jgi:hypothetical protein
MVLDTNVALALFAYADPACSTLAKALHERRLQVVANAATRAECLRQSRASMRFLSTGSPASGVRPQHLILFPMHFGPRPGAGFESSEWRQLT